MKGIDAPGAQAWRPNGTQKWDAPLYIIPKKGGDLYRKSRYNHVKFSLVLILKAFQKKGPHERFYFL